jgi:thaumarchaeosortase
MTQPTKSAFPDISYIRVEGPTVLKKLLKAKKDLALILSFTVPIFILYLFDPSSFSESWIGRFPYSTFLWMLFIELAFNHKVSENRLDSYGKKRWFGIFAAIVFPTFYVILTHVGLMDGIIQLGRLVGVPSGGIYGEGFLQIHWPIELEYLVFTASLLATTVLLYGTRGPKRHMISSFFLGAVGLSFMYDTFYPFASSKILESFVPPVIESTVFLLSSLGYMARMILVSDGWGILVKGSTGRMFAVEINWPCAGIQSLIIYSFTIILVLSIISVRVRRKIVYAMIGAGGTFVANILRIVSICQIGVNTGYEAANMFHDSYGEIFFLVWMAMFILVILVIETKKPALITTRQLTIQPALNKGTA